MSYKKQKNEIIIAEIQYWKRNRLLPETYCDFLLALYTKGDGSAHQMHPTEGTYIKQWGLLSLLLLMVLVVLALSLNDHSLIQVGILLFLGSLGFVLNKKLHKYKNIVGHLALVLFLFIVLMMTISLSGFLFGDQQITNVVIVINLVGWLLLSFKKNYLYLTILSILAILFLIIYVVYI